MPFEIFTKFGRPPAWAEELNRDLNLGLNGHGLTGAIGPWPVAVTRPKKAEGRFRITFRRINSGLLITNHVLGLHYLSPERDLGDRGFDAEVRLAGRADDALALVDPRARELARRLVTDMRGSSTGSVMRAEVTEAEEVAGALDVMRELAQVLQRQSSLDLASRLQQAAAGDDALDLRSHALDRLTVEFRRVRPHGPADREWPISQATAVRLRGAAFLLYLPGPGRTAGLDLIRRTILDAGLPPEEREAALDLLLDESDRSAAGPILEEWMAQPIEPWTLRRAAILACGRRRILGPLLTLSPADDRNALDVVQALDAVADVTAQPQLIAALGHDSQAVPSAAAAALGRFGNLDAVPALGAALEAADPRQSQLRTSLEDALYAIQDRFGQSQAGELSIVALEPLEGSLSRIDPEAGGVSLVSEADAEESLTEPSRELPGQPV
ncbi:MAG: hypothetical protein AAGM22_17455 [Acidobacteriota bacterium]